MELLTWLEATDLSVWLRESDWGQPILLCFHAVGMGMVVGISLMFSARVLGYSRDFPLAGFDRLFGLAWIGFVLNAVSGTLLFLAEPRRLMVTPAFLIKMVLIFLAGFSLWVLGRTLPAPAPAPDALGADGASSGPDVVPRGAKVAAIFPMLLWLGAILAGRLIGYTIEPPSE